MFQNITKNIMTCFDLAAEAASRLPAKGDERSFAWNTLCRAQLEEERGKGRRNGDTFKREGERQTDPLLMREKETCIGSQNVFLFSIKKSNKLILGDQNLSIVGSREE